MISFPFFPSFFPSKRENNMLSKYLGSRDGSEKSEGGLNLK